MKKLLVAAALSSSALFASVPAEAALTQIKDCNASPDDILGGFTQTCKGYYAGQLLSGQSGDVADQKAALTQLGFDITGFKFSSYTKLMGLAGQTVINLPVAGITYLAVHYGGGQGGPTVGHDSTAFYKVDFGAGAPSFTLNFGATSDVVLYSTAAVPEPATWAMMIGGFGLLGGVARRRSRGITATA